MKTERFLAKRVQNLLGESELDDAVSKDLTQELERHIELILSRKEPSEIYYSQGYAAALRSCIEKVRLNNKRKLAQIEDDEEE